MGAISGTVYEKTNGAWVPGAYPVRVYNRETGVLVASVISNVDGTYTIEGLATDVEFYVVAVDANNPFQNPGLQEGVFAT